MCLQSLYADKLKEEHDLVIIGGGVAGYVSAIKAGQEGMKVALCGQGAEPEFLTVAIGSLHREARCFRRNLPERWLHTFKITPQQLAHVSPDPS